MLDGPPADAGDAVDAAGDLIRFVRELHSRAERFLRKHGDDRQVNYEDIAFAATQIADCLSFEYENPVLDPLIVELAARYTAGDEAELAARRGSSGVCNEHPRSFVGAARPGAARALAAAEDTDVLRSSSNGSRT